MPKISELPSASGLSGGETVAVVQNGVTRQLSIANLLGAPRQVIVENARWLTTTETGNTYLNSLELLIEDRPFRAFAKADIVCNPFDVINWEYSFTPSLEDCSNNWTMSFDGESPYPSYNEYTASGGSWRITATTGAFNEAGNAVAVWVAGVVVGTLTAVNQSVEFSVGYKENPLMTFSQPNALFSAEIMVEQIRRYEDNGSIPVVNAYNDQLILYYDSTPNRGIFRAKAQVYNNQGQLISSSNEITLTVVAVIIAQ